MTLKFAPLAAALLIGAVVTLSGCAAEPSAAGKDAIPAPEGSSDIQSDAVWLDGGRMIGLVTWGSSSCIPFVGEAKVAGQEITVSLSDTIEGVEEQRPCTSDFSPRASLVGVPAGVDPHKDVTLNVTYNEQEFVVELDGDSALTGTPGESTDYLPSASWMSDDAGIVLVTWGSSTCVPQVASVEETATEIIATFAQQDGVCTMDLFPRTTILGVSEKVDGQVLTLVGDNLDATVQLIG